MNRTARRSSSRLSPWTALPLAALLLSAVAEAQFRPRPAPRAPAARPVYRPPQHQLPARPQPRVHATRPAPHNVNPPARPMPHGVRRATIWQRPGPRLPGAPENALVPTTIDQTAVSNGRGGGRGGSRPVAPVSLTLDSVSADPEVKKRARAAALDFFRSKLSGKAAAPAIRRVTRLRWHKSLAAATAQARREGKPVLWIQALGDLTGFT